MTKPDAILEAQENNGRRHSLHLTPSNGGNMRGWMWYDNDPGRNIEEKVGLAAIQYRTRFGRLPNTCYVNHKAISDEFKVDKVKVLAASNILPNHFWLGVRG